MFCSKDSQLRSASSWTLGPLISEREATGEISGSEDPPTLNALSCNPFSVWILEKLNGPSARELQSLQNRFNHATSPQPLQGSNRSCSEAFRMACRKRCCGVAADAQRTRLPRDTLRWLPVLWQAFLSVHLCPEWLVEMCLAVVTPRTITNACSRNPGARVRTSWLKQCSKMSGYTWTAGSLKTWKSLPKI